MPVLIDGHNLIGRLPGMSLQDPDDEEGLVRLLASYASRTKKAITVVFDPGEASSLAHTRRHGGVTVVFAPRGSNADALIVRRVLDSHNPREWLVVTSDHELTAKVSRLGARVCSAEAFAVELHAPQAGGTGRKEMPLSNDEVAAWLQVFEKRQRGETSQ